MSFRQFTSSLISLVIKGIILTVPLVVTVVALVSLVQFIDGLVPIDSDIPGAGIFIACLFLAFMGYIGSTFIAKPIIDAFQRIIDKAPVVKTIYSTIKDVINALIGKKKAFGSPVRVRLTNDGVLQKVGFVTEEDLSILGLDNEWVAVYFPHSYNFSGNLFLVQSKFITPIDAPSSDVMKFVVSGGISGLTPQDDEI